MKYWLLAATMALSFQARAQGLEITGFKPYGKDPVNSSEQIVHYLGEQGYRTSVLPVDYQGAFEHIDSLLALKPDILLMMGQGGDSLYLEVTAKNMRDDTTHTWRWGKVPKPAIHQVPIDKKGPRTISVTYQQEEQLWAYALMHPQFYISTDAGTYLCNAAFYHALKKVQKKICQQTYFSCTSPATHIQVHQCVKASKNLLKSYGLKA